MQGTDPGERFRRRALRRGYKVDEVDEFLDRVEATLGGRPHGEPVAPDEVHDVVFRVRFGGYDEWEVDKHLDRVERQLAEAEGQAPAPRADRREVAAGGRAAAAPVAVGSRAGGGRAVATPSAAPVGGGRAAGGRGRQVEDAPTQYVPPVRDDMELDETMDSPRPARAAAVKPPVDEGFGHLRGDGDGDATQMYAPVDEYGDPRYDDTDDDDHYEVGGYDDRHAAAAAPVDDYVEPPRAGQGSWNNQPGRHGRSEMTAEMPQYKPSSYGPEDADRVAHLRSTFKQRRFGSGYDLNQVDRLFDGITAVVTGRSGGRLDPEDLSANFDLVQGGYYEDEVDAALEEVRELIARSDG